jgi:D-aminopeptidase
MPVFRSERPLCAGQERLTRGPRSSRVVETAKCRKIAAAAAKAKVEASVGDAVDKGKITRSRRKHWVSLIEADPGMADVLAAVPNETAVPMSEVGHSADNTADLAEAAEWLF